MVRRTRWVFALAAVFAGFAFSTPAKAQESAPAAAESEDAAGSETPPDEHAPEPDVTVRGARELPLRYEGAVRTPEMRARQRARGRCALRAQSAADATRPELDTPEDVCRDDR